MYVCERLARNTPGQLLAELDKFLEIFHVGC